MLRATAFRIAVRVVPIALSYSDLCAANPDSWWKPSRKTVRAFPFRELHGEMATSAAAGMNQHALAWLQLRRVEHDCHAVIAANFTARARIVMKRVSVWPRVLVRERRSTPPYAPLRVGSGRL